MNLNCAASYVSRLSTQLATERKGEGLRSAGREYRRMRRSEPATSARPALIRYVGYAARCEKRPVKPYVGPNCFLLLCFSPETSYLEY